MYKKYLKQINMKELDLINYFQLFSFFYINKCIIYISFNSFFIHFFLIYLFHKHVKIILLFLNLFFFYLLK